MDAFDRMANGIGCGRPKCGQCGPVGHERVLNRRMARTRLREALRSEVEDGLQEITEERAAVIQVRVAALYERWHAEDTERRVQRDAEMARVRRGGR